MDTTRDRILGVARQLFGDQGYDGTSLREIAEHLGISKAALYHHFQSKGQILEALVQPLLTLQVELVDLLDQAETVEQWAEVVDWVIDSVLDNSDMFLFFERNRAAVVAAQERPDAFGGARFNQRLNDAVDRLGVTTRDKVRLASVLSSVVGFESVAPKVFLESDRVELRSELVAMTREMLGVAQPASPTPRS